MNEWEIVAALLGVGILPCLTVAALRPATHALTALELVGTLLASALMALCEGFHRQPFIDLAVAFALLSMLGAIAFARLMEAEL